MISNGTKLGPYEVLAPLGAGGMGEVYRARDTRLGRDVAIKILPVELCRDAVRKQRFEREAKTISQLNHPNICVLHDVGSQDGVDYLVMECVEGETLAKRLEKGPLPLEQALKYGAQVADALGKAHRAGIVHRDLKPGNIMLTSGGAKLLDFGLAKEAAPLANLATMTVTKVATPVTQEGTIVGTFQYMSPEQIEGKELDGRSDIFSLGAVLYEMVTGQRAFEGKSQLSVASAILEKEPPAISEVKPLTPASLGHAIERCLAKDPEERWQSASDLSGELKWVVGSTRSGTSEKTSNKLKTRRVLRWAVAGISVIALAILIGWWWASKQVRERLQFYAAMPLASGSLAMGPDGRTVALVAKTEATSRNAIWLYQVGTSEYRRLAGTDGASYPFWAPDGKALAFFADGKLKRIDLSGGSTQTICDAPSGRGGAWGKDGTILFTPKALSGVGLHRVAASGGQATPVTFPDTKRGELSHRWPVFLSDGLHYLYLAENFSEKPGVDGVFLGKLGSTDKKLLLEASSNVSVVKPGYIFYHKEGSLFAQPFDLQRLELNGEPVLVLGDLQYRPQVNAAVFDVSAGGTVVAQKGSGITLSQPTWYDRRGRMLGVVGKPGMYGNVFLNPNGTAAGVDRTDLVNHNTDIWTYGLQDESERRLTFHPAADYLPIWSPDGRQIVFWSDRNNGLYVKDADGAQEEKNIEYEKDEVFPNDWSKDGKSILYMTNNELRLLSYPEMKSRLFLNGPYATKTGQFSPDGKWVAYSSNETGRWEVYVTSFPEPKGKWQVSVDGGDQPRWRQDGKELFFLSVDSKLMAAPVTTGASFKSGSPVSLFQAVPHEPGTIFDIFAYDVSKDGQRFLINTQVQNRETQPMTVILNWDAERKKK